MLSYIAQGLVVCAVFAIAWRVLLHIVTKTDFHNIPAPAAPSLLKGERSIVFHAFSLTPDLPPGNFSQLFNDNAWAFHAELRQKCMLLFCLGVADDALIS